MFKNHKKIIIGSRASSLAKKQVEIFKKESLKINRKLNFETKNNFIFGVTYNHISNADIGSTNPGSDSIMIGFRYKTN